MHTLTLAKGTYTVGGKSVEVVDWPVDIAEKLIVPYGVDKIKGEYQEEEAIQAITLPPTVKTIGSWAFNSCAKLNTVAFNEGLKTIGSYAFASTGLTSIEIPKGVETIGDSAFSYCESLTTVILNDGLVKITGNPFYDSPVTTLTSNSERFVMSENDMELIDTETGTLVIFVCSKLSGDGAYQTSEDDKIIGTFAFYECSKLKSVTLSEGVTAINENAFQSPYLVKVSVSKTVKSIGDYAFTGGISLSTITIEEGMSGTIGNYFLMSTLGVTELTLPQSLWGDDSLILPNAFTTSNLKKNHSQL